MDVVCLDLEGVLVPEIWKAVAGRTGIAALNRTTRDEPDYDVLMRYRLDILEREGITLPLIQEVIAGMRPLEGAVEFVEWLKGVAPVLILSDTFAEFAAPLMRQLGSPAIFCHSLVVDPAGKITGYRLRQQDQKRRAVEALRGLNFRVLASGDSYNDLTMLQAADRAVLFRPAETMKAEYPEFPVTQDHRELRRVLEGWLS